MQIRFRDRWNIQDIILLSANPGYSYKVAERPRIITKDRFSFMQGFPVREFELSWDIEESDYEQLRYLFDMVGPSRTPFLFLDHNGINHIVNPHFSILSPQAFSFVSNEKIDLNLTPIKGWSILSGSQESILEKASASFMKDLWRLSLKAGDTETSGVKSSPIPFSSSLNLTISIYLTCTNPTYPAKARVQILALDSAKALLSTTTVIEQVIANASYKRFSGSINANTLPSSTRYAQIQIENRPDPTLGINFSYLWADAVQLEAWHYASDYQDQGVFLVTWEDDEFPLEWTGYNRYEGTMRLKEVLL